MNDRTLSGFFCLSVVGLSTRDLGGLRAGTGKGEFIYFYDRMRHFGAGYALWGGGGAVGHSGIINGGDFN